MWQTMSIKETCEKLKTNIINGLTKEEVEERIWKKQINRKEKRKYNSKIYKAVQ